MAVGPIDELWLTNENHGHFVSSANLFVQKAAGVPKTFSIQFTIQGTDTCLTVDFGDGNRAVYTDDISKCPTLASEFSGNRQRSREVVAAVVVAVVVLAVT